MLGTILMILILITGLALCFIILIQRGRGGGLVGALGGGGGASAFGTRAGDTFTRITIGIALFWIVLNMGMNLAIQPERQAQNLGGPAPTGPAPTNPGGE